MPASRATEVDHSVRTRLTRLIARQETRFLIVGAWNTVVGYAIFVAVHLAAQSLISTTWVLVVSYLIAVPHSYLTQRMFVFRSTGGWRAQFGRFFLSNSIVFASNLLFLPAFIRATDIRPVLAQAIYVAASTIASYLLHKHFSFSDEQQEGIRQ